MAIKYGLLTFLVIGCAEICLGDPTPSCSCDPSQSTNTPNPFYEFIRGFGYYKLSSIQQTWDQGKEICQNEGAHLAIVNSGNEESILDELRRRMPNPRIGYYIYTGVRRINGAWKTISNEDIKFNNWEENPQPGTGDCSAYSTETRKFRAFPCNTSLLFACELEV